MKKAISSFAFGKGQKRGSRLLASTALTAAGLMAFASPAFAVDDLTTPIGENVVGGAATFDRPELGQLNIHQSTDRVIINWDSFNIGQGATTQFYQPGSGSLAVNRVTGKGTDPTQILGTLKANGRVMVLDRNGVFFGANSRLDVGGIIASTGNVDDNAIMGGASKIQFHDFGDGSIVNNGHISVADAGLVSFVGKNVANNGVINAKVGKVALAAGDTTATLDLYGDGLVEFAVDGAKGKVLASNAGTINAEGGTVAITANAAKDVVDNVINMDGIINVSSVTQKGGKIILGGGKSGTVKVAGKIKADGQGGGDVKVTGKNVIVTDTAELTANGGTSGNGGDIRVIGENTAIVHGTFEARGGSTGGDGGFVEVSGYEYLNFRIGNVDTRAAYGAAGTLLIDPNDILIIGGVGDGHDNGGANGPGPSGGSGNTGDGGAYTTPTSDGASPYTIYESEIEGQSATTNIIIQARRNISTSAGTTTDGIVTLAADRNLTIETQNNAGFSGGIDLTNLGFQVQGTGNMSIVAATGTVGTGDVRVGTLLAENGNINVLTDNGQIYLEKGAINVSGTGGVGFNASDRIFIDNDIRTNGGNITMEANRFTIDDTDAASDNLDQLISNGGDIRITANEVKLGETGGDPVAGEVLVDAGNGSILFERKTAGSIGLGATIGDTQLSNAELASLRARQLYIGSPVEANNKVTQIYVNSIDTTANITGRVTLSNYLNQTEGVNGGLMFGAGAIDNNNVHIIGNNAFNGLTVNANDHVLVFDNSVITSNGSVVFNADANAQGVGALVMGQLSLIDTNGNDFTFNGHQALFGGTYGAPMINAEGGNILINNDHVFYSYTPNTLATSGTGTITINQWDKNFTDPTGFWGNHDGSVQNAVNAVANSGTGLNTVIVGEGTYNESVTIAEDNFLIRSRLNYNVNPNTGVRGAESIITPNSPGFYITGDNVEINGMLVTGADDNGIWVNGGKNAVLKNNIIHDVDGEGVYAVNADGIKVQNNRIYDIHTKGPLTGSGVRFFSVDGGLVQGNTIYDTEWDGIRITGSSNIDVKSNNIQDVARTGIYMQNVEKARLFGNFIKTTGEAGIEFYDGSNANIASNVVTKTGNHGIYIHGTKGTNWISYNDIDSTGTSAAGKGDGIHANKVSLLTVQHNEIGLDDGAFNIKGEGIYATKLSDIKVLNNKITNTKSTAPLIGSGVRFFSVSDALVQDNKIYNTDWDGIRITGSSNVDVKTNDIDNVKRTGIYMQNVEKSDIFGNFVNTTGEAGIEFYDGSNANIASNDLGGTGNHGVYIHGTKGTNWVSYNNIDSTGIGSTGKGDGIHANKVSLLTVQHNKIGLDDGAFNIKGEGIYATKLSDIKVLNNEITNTKSTAPLIGSGVRFFSVADALVQGNKIYNTDWDGVRITGSSNVDVKSNNIQNVKRTGIYMQNVEKSRIFGNFVKTTGEAGIEFYDGSKANIASNVVTKTGNHGVYIHGTTGTNWVSYNDIDSTGTSGLKGDGVHANNVSNLTIQYNEIGLDDGASNIKGDGIYAANMYGVKVANNKVKNAAYNGIHSLDNDSAYIVRNNVKLSALNGILAEGGYNVTIGDYEGSEGEDNGNHVDNSGVNGIEVDGTTGDVFVLYNTVSNSGTAGANGTDGDGIQIHGQEEPEYYDRVIALLEAMGDTFVKVIGNNVTASAEDGIDVHDIEGSVVIDANVVSNSGYNEASLDENADYNGHDGIFVSNVRPGTPVVAGRAAVSPTGTYTVSITNNDVDTNQDDGIEVINSGRTLIQGNDIYNVGQNATYYDQDGYGADGIHVRNVYAEDDYYYDDEIYYKSAMFVLDPVTDSSVDILDNRVNVDRETGEFIGNTADDGIQVLYSGNTVIDSNHVANSGFIGEEPSEGEGEMSARVEGPIQNVDGWGADGIHVYLGGGDVKKVALVEGPSYGYGVSADITNNFVDNSADDGIDADYVNYLTVDGNDVDVSGNQGIEIIGGGSGYPGTAIGGEESEELPVASLIGLFEVEPSWTAVVTNNIVNNSKRNGIKIENYDQIEASYNEVSNSGRSGLLVTGPRNGYVHVEGNTFTDNRIGATFRSGLIDLTGDSNTFNGGRVGLRFSPFEYTDWQMVPDGDWFDIIPVEMRAFLELVDDDAPGVDPASADAPTANFGGTIGAQIFNNQSRYFVELRNGAFYNPGTPTWLNGTQSTYTVGATTLTPGTNALTPDQWAFLEPMFRDWNDGGLVGRFWGLAVPAGTIEIDQQNIFDQFAPFAALAGQVNVVLTGLPRLAGGPAPTPTAFDPNAIEPQAGGDGSETASMSPEELNAIQTAAGGEGGSNSSCWIDASAAATGGSTSFTFSSVINQTTLAQETSCGSAQPQ